MALSGKFSDYPSSYLGLYCEWKAEQSVAGNYSDITLDVYLKYYALTVGARTDATISIAGASETFSTKAISESKQVPHTKFLKSKTLRLVHDSSGKRNNVKLKASWRFDGTYAGESIGTIVAETEINLNKIDRSAPKIIANISNVTANGFNIYVSSDTQVDRWRYSLDDGVTYIEFFSDDKTSASVDITEVKANTTYNIKVEGRKQINQVCGYATKTIKTVGAAEITAAPTFYVDTKTVQIKPTLTVYESKFKNIISMYSDNTHLFDIAEFYSSAGKISKTFTLSNEQITTLLKNMISNKAKEFSLRIASYESTVVDGETVDVIVGENSKNIIAKTTAENSAPIAGVIDWYDLLQNVGTFVFDGDEKVAVQNLSLLVFTLSDFVLKNEADFDHCTIQIGDYVKSSNKNATTMILNNEITVSEGDYDVILTYYDSRGYSCSVTKPIRIVSYEQPCFAKILLNRENMVGDVVSLSINCNFSSVESQNEIKEFKFRYKKTGDTDYGEWQTLSEENGTLVFNGDTMNFKNDSFISLSTSFAYNFEFSLLDKGLSALNYPAITAFALLNKGIPAMAVRNDPSGSGKAFIGINNREPRYPLDVEGDIAMNGYPVLGFRSALGPEEDFHSEKFKQNGLWTQAYDKATREGEVAYDNYPCEKAGFLESIVSDRNYILHRYTAYDLSGMWIETYYPKKNADGTEIGEWYGWHQVPFGPKKIEIIPATDDFSINRAYCSAYGGIVTLYVNMSCLSTLTVGTEYKVATLSDVKFAPTASVATLGILGKNSSCAAWYRKDTGLYIRPNSTLTDGGDFEFNLTWDVDAEWQ